MRLKLKVLNISFVCVIYVLSCRLLKCPITFVFAQWWDLKRFTVPRHQTLNEDNTFTLHITPPLRKHFVGSSRVFSSLHSKPCLSALVNVARLFIGQSDSAALLFFS